MRIHVTANGKATTVSVDDVLIDYLGAITVRKNPKHHTDAKRQHEGAKRAVQKLVLSADDLPQKNLSQYVQKTIIEHIATPDLEAILTARGARFVPPKQSPRPVGDSEKADQVMKELLESMGRKAT